MSRDLYWRNIPSLNDNLEPLLSAPEKMRVLKDDNGPFFVWTGSGPIAQLQKIDLSESTIESLNNTGLNFYMYEPLGMRVANYNGRSYEGELLGEIPIDLVESNDLISINMFAEKFQLTNITVFVCDYNISKLQPLYKNLKLKCLDFFLRSIHYRDYYSLIENNFTKRFWCGNWRYVPHRHIVTAYLVNFDGNYSWNLSCDYDTIKNNNWFDFDNIDPDRLLKLKHGIDVLKNNVFSIDQQTSAVEVKDSQDYYVPAGNLKHTDKLIKSYKDCFCAVVNESRYASPLAYLSEKTLTAINCEVPFLLVASPYTLKYLKEFGFKTFDQWWSEDYDLEENHEKRLLMIFDLIDYINSKSIDELKIIYDEMKPVLAHNLKILKTIPTNKTIL